MTKARVREDVKLTLPIGAGPQPGEASLVASTDLGTSSPICCLPVALGATWPGPDSDEDEEWKQLPADLPPVVDAHVHLFPDKVFAAMWRWFDKHAWPVRYQLTSEQVLKFLFARGVQRIVALTYAHKAGMARSLNRYIADLCEQDARIIGLGTVFPGEDDAVAVVEQAFAWGLRGIKLHCHVQGLAPDDPRMDPIYDACARHQRVLVIHAGREPSSPAYPIDTHEICSAKRVQNVLQNFPRLKVCVPHLGADEFGEYEKLVESFDNLWLDTTMMGAEYFDYRPPLELYRVRPERIMYGTDFPNIPYVWNRELQKLMALSLSEHERRLLFGQNAIELYGA